MTRSELLATLASAYEAIQSADAKESTLHPSLCYGTHPVFSGISSAIESLSPNSLRIWSECGEWRWYEEQVRERAAIVEACEETVEGCKDRYEIVFSHTPFWVHEEDDLADLTDEQALAYLNLKDAQDELKQEELLLSQMLVTLDALPITQEEKEGLL